MTVVAPGANVPAAHAKFAGTWTGWFGLDPAFGYDNLTLDINRKAGKASATETRRFSPKSQFAEEMDAFAASLDAGETPRTPGAEGLQDMKIMAAIYQSARDSF